MKPLEPELRQRLKRLDLAAPKIKYAVEPLLYCLEELALAAYANYEETGLDPAHLPYDPNWAQCMQYEPTGDIIVVTARKRDKLIGYALGLLGRFKHSKGKTYADLDTIWLHPDHRSGFIGYNLLKHWEAAVLERKPIDFFTINSTHKHPIGALLKRLGYKPVETVYYKYVGE